MGSFLEVSKLAIATYLHDKWSETYGILKIYLTIALVTLSVLTSIGIYGLLSTGFQKNIAGLEINNKKIVWRLHSENKTYNYVVDSVDIVIPNMYVVYYTMNKETNKECVFFILNDGDKTFIYDSWKINQTQKQGWQAVIE